MLQKMFENKNVKRAGWSLLNSAMAFTVTAIAYMATENNPWAITVLPVAQAASQFATKYINKNYLQ